MHERAFLRVIRGLGSCYVNAIQMQGVLYLIKYTVGRGGILKTFTLVLSTIANRTCLLQEKFVYFSSYHSQMFYKIGVF